MLFDEQVARRYEAWYETGEGRRADALEKALLLRMLRRFRGARNLLEVGCGTGHFTRWFAHLWLRPVGLDLSPAMLAEARKKDGVALVLGDAAHLPFADGSFELVALITTLEFLPQPERALREAARVARRGIILGVLNGLSLLALRRRLQGLFRESVYSRAHLFHVWELKSLVQHALGDRAMTVNWRTTLFPRVLGGRESLLPFGGFIGMWIDLEEDRELRRAGWLCTPSRARRHGSAGGHTSTPRPTSSAM